MRESSFWSNRARRLLPIGAFAKRIENALEAGTPDVFYCYEGRSGWIENKYLAQRPTWDSTVVFSPQRGIRLEQRLWWKFYLRAGGRGLIIAGIGSDAFVWQANEALIDTFNEMRYSDIERTAMPLTREQLERWL